MDSNVEPPSFLQVNVSGGEPREVQLKLREDPAGTVIVDDDGVSINGAAM